jgi:HSP20 family molecular chaperone IbpA
MLMASTAELMRDQIRAIYHAVTGSDLPEREAQGGAAPTPPPAEEVSRRFAELEAWSRQVPSVAERVPPFSFAPPLDAYREDRELIVELALPGVEKSDVEVQLSGDLLSVSGVRAGGAIGNGRTYFHAEIPRGPFRRVILLPHPVMGEPRVTVERGVVRIQLAKAPKAAPAKA